MEGCLGRFVSVARMCLILTKKNKDVGIETDHIKADRKAARRTGEEESVT